MTTSFKHLAAGLACAATLLLTACGGGGGGGTSAPAVPAAVATASATSVVIGNAVTLDGSGSSGPSGATLSYQWSLSSRPEGSTAALTNATTAKPSFTPDVAGSYVAELSVTTGQSSAATRVTITATTDTPTAIIATPSQTVLLGSTVTLDGSTSVPPTGVAASALTYQWRLTEQPTGDPVAVLVGATGAKATFSAGKSGIYKATLIVTHDGKSSPAAEAQVNVNTGNSAPVAVAKVLIGSTEVAATKGSTGNLTTTGTVTRGQTITLDGSGSTDANGDTLHYRWSFPPYVANSTLPPKPHGSSATLSNANSAKAEFTADSAGTYHLDLLVYDNSVAVTQRVIINVTKLAGAANTPPVAVYGQVNVDSLEYEVGAWAYPGGGRSYDVDGDVLTYNWTWWNTATPDDKKTSSAAGVNGAGLNVGNAAPAGTYQVELVVNDGQADSAKVTGTFTIKIGANITPVPLAKVETGTVLVGQTIQLDGSGSTDRNGDQLSYQWTLTDRPDGSSAVVLNATSAKASVVTDKPGRYAAYLQVTDSKGARSNPATTGAYVTVFAKAVNNAPVVANFTDGYIGTTDQPMVIWENFVGSGAAAYTGYPASFSATIFDPDLDNPLYYILTATKYPAGSTFTKSVSGQAFSGSMVGIGDPASTYSIGNVFLLTQPGEYEFQLLASDGVAYSETRTVNFSVVKRENYPGILLSTITYNGNNVQATPQVLWPVKVLDPYSYVGWTSTGGVMRMNTQPYQLYAADRDYTITDLVASSTNASFKPYFEGLQNGQVIRKGETVTFNIYRPVIADEAALAKGLSDIGGQYGYDSEQYKAEAARVNAIYETYKFTWSFGIAEKAGRTFYTGPTN